MITTLSGIITEKYEHFAILEVSGVGYKVFFPFRVLSSISRDDQGKWYIYHHIREDRQELFGFASQEDLQMFEWLLDVSGIGPKSALNILGSADAPTLYACIVQKDVDRLSAIPKIGKKNAEKMILELHKKLSKTSFSSETNENRDETYRETVEALVGLGYRQSQAELAAAKTSNAEIDISQRIKAALKHLS